MAHLWYLLWHLTRQRVGRCGPCWIYAAAEAADELCDGDDDGDDWESLLETYCCWHRQLLLGWRCPQLWALAQPLVSAVSRCASEWSSRWHNDWRRSGGPSWSCYPARSRFPAAGFFQTSSEKKNNQSIKKPNSIYIDQKNLMKSFDISKIYGYI